MKVTHKVAIFYLVVYSHEAKMLSVGAVSHMLAFLKNLFEKKILGRQTRIPLTDLHQAYLVPFDRDGKLIDERLMLKDISLNGFAIRASLEEWGFSKGMELEANLHLWEKIFVIRFKFLHLHHNFSGGKIVKTADDYEEEFLKIFEPEIRSLELLNEIRRSPNKETFFNDYCGVKLNGEDFIFFYRNKVIRYYHGKMKIFDQEEGKDPLNNKELNHRIETDKFELEDLHLLVRFLLTFKGHVRVDIDEVAQALQKRFRKVINAPS